MKTTMIKSMLRAAIFTGAVGLLPAVALAQNPMNGAAPGGVRAMEGTPDHAQAQARTNAPNVTDPSGPRGQGGVPDHAQAEARGVTASTPTEQQQSPSVPDHAQAESRSDNDATK